MIGNPLDYEFLDYNDLLRMKVVTSRSDLSRKIKRGVIPGPEKSSASMQAAAKWRKSVIYEAIDRQRDLTAAE